MNRRNFNRLSVTTALAFLLPEVRQDRTRQASAQGNHPQEHVAAMKRHAQFHSGAKVTIAMLIYPGMFLQDLVGPLAMFEAMMNREIHLVWKDKSPVNAGSLIPVTATKSFSECPDQMDVLFVPGGAEGTLKVMEDAEVLQFLAEKGPGAKYVTSVCTGSLILGAAGLLKGYKATSHWLTRDILSEFGAVPTDQRIVTDRNRITGGGVTAGLDFGLAIVAKLRNESYAQAVQLYLEYDPQPPFNAGSPKTAGRDAQEFLNEMFAPFTRAARETARRKTKTR